jgi:hypothetical protein
VIYISKKQFGDSPDDTTCRNFKFALCVGGPAFQVRNEMDQPGAFTVVSPAADRKSHQVRQLVDYLVSVLGGRQMFFYNVHAGLYEEVNLRTLEFKTDEMAAVQTRSSEIVGHHNADAPFESLRLFPA